MNLIKLSGLVGCSVLTAAAASGAQYSLSIAGTDAIWLAGRTDLLPIPAYTGTDVPGWPIDRHNSGTPEMLPETYPSFIPVAGGDIVRVADPAVGGISFFNGIGAPLYGPEGNSPASAITSLGGISGYLGTQGALVGVFLDDSVPSAGPAPATIDFQPAAARDFDFIAPEIGQIFFIGDGVNSALAFQEFVAPAGATRLFFGIPDGFGFLGAPGAYDDNDGAYRIQVGVNSLPIPEGETYLVGGLLALGAAGWTWRNRRTR